MEQPSEKQEDCNLEAEELSWSVPLEGDIVPLEDIEEAKRSIASSTLVGKIICNKTVNRGAVKSILFKAWGEPDSMSIADLGPNTFMFTFTEEDTPKRIMEESPWNVMGHLLSLQWWSPWCSITEVSYDLVDFWVQAHGVPLEALSSRAATRIGERIGGLMEVEDPVVDGRILRSFLRMRVTIDIRKPLTTGFWVPRKEKNPVWVWLKYEKLQEYCFQCGRIGHEAKQCKEHKVMSVLNPQKPRYGPGMGAAVAKPLEAICREVEGWQRRHSANEEGREARADPHGQEASAQGEGRWSEQQGSQIHKSFKLDLVGVGTSSINEYGGSRSPNLTDNQEMRAPDENSGQQASGECSREEVFISGQVKVGPFPFTEASTCPDQAQWSELSSNYKVGPNKVNAKVKGMSTTTTPQQNLPYFKKFSEITYGKTITEVCGNSTYFVNFPEGEDLSEKEANLVTDEGVGSKLAEQLARFLYVKRKSQDSSTFLENYMENDQHSGANAKNKRRKVEKLIEVSGRRDSNDTAEEAGLIMPHPQQ